MRCLSPLLVLAIACSRPSPTPPPPAEQTPGFDFDPAHISGQLDAFIPSIGASWGEAYQFSGHVHLASGDRVLYSKGFGVADRSTGRAPTADTSFRIGSVTKQFTAAAIMLLAREGKLTVDDTIAKHLPDYPAETAGKVTIHQLLTHTSGIPSYTGIQAVLETRDQPRTTAELMATFSGLPLEFEPGSKHVYSNSGYVVLGAIIERISGQSYAEFMHARIFEPAGLSSTFVGDPTGPGDHALGYETKGDQVAPAHPIDMSIPHAAGAIRSTANDLVTWARVLRAGSLLDHDSQKRMFTPEKVSMDGPTGYGYGWLITEGKEKLLHHGGGIDGFLTYYLLAVASDLTLVVWTNNPVVDVNQMKETLVLVAYGGTAELDKSAPPQLLSDDEAGRITGTYQLTADSRKKAEALGLPAEVITSIETAALSGRDGKLILDPAGQPEAELAKVADNIFESKKHGVKLTVSYGANPAAASGFQIEQGPLSLSYERPAP